jgi:N-acetylmuramoyl-L-alanine amidase
MGRLLGWLILGTAVAHADWPALERFQGTMTRTEFAALLTNVYCPSGAITNYLTYGRNTVTLAPNFTLRFADAPPAPAPVKLRRITLDPGHIGGAWARMEERWFQRGSDRPVQEAELNLNVARLLDRQLTAAGFAVSLTKTNFEPVTAQRPDDFRARAEQEIPASPDEAQRADAVRQRQEMLFYRSAEIEARARLVNEHHRPDLVVCLHFNAVAWDECQSLVDDNRLVVFVHGNYLPAEVADEAQRYRLFYKLLSRSHAVELPVAETLAEALAAATGLPAVEYAPGGPAARVGANRYVYARNLAASRLFDAPVVFLEPYYMNNRQVYERLQKDPGIFREYADTVFNGLVRFR